VFAQALRTVRRLPRPGSTRPPPAARLRLYGLYKQSMEGDVEAILSRPSLPHTSSPIVADDDGAESRQRKKEADVRGEIEKWDAWRACAGFSRTEAKRRYVEVLIQTMKVYAAGTAEARELVEELEFVWNQIRSQTGSEESLRNTARGGAGGAAHAQEVDEEGRLRVLSPVSRGGSGEIVEGEDASIPEREHTQPEDDDDEVEEFRDALDGSERNPQQHPLDRRRSRRPSPSALKWRRQIETALTKISTELAALHEQIDEFNLNSTRTGSLGITRQKSGMLAWMRWLFWMALRQLAVDALVLAILLVWGGWSGDDRCENWVRRRWSQWRSMVQRWKGVGGRHWKWDWIALVMRIVPARFL